MFSASLHENVVIFKRKGLRKALRSCIGIMLSDPLLGFDIPYQAECGVSVVVYLPYGLTTAFMRINEMRLHTFVILTSWLEPPGMDMEDLTKS